MHIDIQRAKSSLDYNSETGLFYWNVSVARCVKVGDIAGCKTHEGYIQIRLNGASIRAHRLAWAMHYGYQPLEIDHINCDKSDNRISNLRECTNSENNANKQIQKNNTSGIKGVCWNKNSAKWQASIKKNRNKIYLGSFINIEDAAKAYDEASKLHHGEFARLK